MELQFLGQAGFLIKTERLEFIIDPYLSDSVAEKYGIHLSRQTPVIMRPEELTSIDWILLTHAHLDHADPQTLLPLAAASPQAKFLAPYECRSLLKEWNLGDREIHTPRSKWTSLGNDLEVLTVPAAHIALERSFTGESRYAGYLLRSNGITLYHAGDTIPHPEIFASLAGERIDYALLPVNERNYYRERDGIVGNMTVREAFQMTTDLGASTLIPTHWDMFAPNRVHPAEIELLHKIEACPFSLEIMSAGAVKLLATR